MSDEKTKRIAIKLAGGPEKWAELPDEGRNFFIQEVEEMREALAAPNAPDDTESDEVILQAIADNRNAQIENFINADYKELFKNAIAQNARYTINSVLKAVGNLSKINSFYEVIIENNPKYEELRTANATVTLTPKDDAPEDVKRLHNLFVEAWAEAEKEYKKAQDPERLKQEKEEKAVQDSINAGLAALAIRPNTAVSNVLLEAEMFSEKYKDGRDIPTYNVGSGKELTTFAAVSIKDDANIKTSRPITEYEDALQVAVLSLIYDREEAGLLRVFSLDQICRQLMAAGDSRGRKVTPKTKEKVSYLLENVLNKIDLEIDATDELRARKQIGPEDFWNVKGPILPLERIDFGKLGGHTVKIYRYGTPITLDYARRNKQLIKTPVNALDIKEINEKGEIIEDCPVTLTEERIAIRNYLWRRVENMRSDEDRARDSWRLNEWRRKNKNDATAKEKSIEEYRKLKRVILFNTLFEEVGTSSNVAKVRAKDFAITVFRNWRATGRIKSFTLRYRGKSKKQIEAIEKIVFP